MGWKAKYYEVFGLTEGATKSEVKRQYRKLAMKFHPDRNPDPKAHKLFLDLTEAYQILMDDSAVRPTRNIRDTTSTSTKSAAEQRQERYRQGQERYRQYIQNKKIASERAFQNFTQGIRWKIFKISAIISCIVGILLFLDFVLPTRTENHVIISSSSRTYNGLNNNLIREVNTDKNISMYLADFYLTEKIRTWPVVDVERTFIFRNPVMVVHRYENEIDRYAVDFSVANLFPYLSLLLLIPVLTYHYKKNSPGFYIAYFISQYLIVLVVVYILFSQLRWLHALTFGFL